MACSPVARVATHTIAANNLKQHLCPTLLNSPSHASLGHAPAMLLWHWPRCTPAGTAHACMPVAVACGVQRAGRGRQCYTTTAIPLRLYRYMHPHQLREAGGHAPPQCVCSCISSVHANSAPLQRRCRGSVHAVCWCAMHAVCGVRICGVLRLCIARCRWIRLDALL